MQPDFCIDFLNRKCQLTKRTCKNIHVTSEHRELLKRVCIKYLSGRCDSKNCYEHKSLKQLKIPTPATYYENIPVIEDYTNGKFCKTYIIKHKCIPKCPDIHPINRDILSMRKCCLDFLLDGRCNTPGCGKPHLTYADIDVWPPSAYANKYPKIEICVDWLNGKCRDSDVDCKWIHVEPNHIKLLTKNSNHEEMLRMHLGVNIRDYEYKFPPVSPMPDEAPVPVVVAVQQPQAPQKSASPPIPQQKPVKSPVTQPPIGTPPVNVEINLPLDQLLTKLVGAFGELKQLYTSEASSKMNTEGELVQLKQKLIEETALLREEENNLMKYFFLDVVVPEDYSNGRYTDEMNPDSLLPGSLKDAIKVDKLRIDSPPSNNNHINYEENSANKFRAQQLCQTIRLLLRQFNPDSVPQALQDVTIQRKELEAQANQAASKLEQVQAERVALSKKYDYANTSNGYISDDMENNHSSMRKDSSVLANLTNSIYCVICHERAREMVLVPCGHLEYCEECAQDIYQCTSCRSPIVHRLKVKR